VTASTLRYLLDTNAISALAKQPQGAIATRIHEVGENTICTSIIVACELRFGVLKRGSARLTKQIDAILKALPVLPIEPSVDTHYAAIRHALETAGTPASTPVGPNDLLIAAHARALELTVVTADLSEFLRVPGLKVECWEAPTAR